MPLIPQLLSHFSRVQLCVTPKTAAHQAPPSLGFSRKEHWSGLPFPSPLIPLTPCKSMALSTERAVIALASVTRLNFRKFNHSEPSHSFSLALFSPLLFSLQFGFFLSEILSPQGWSHGFGRFRLTNL